MTRKYILLHIPVYILACFGLCIVILLFGAYAGKSKQTTAYTAVVGDGVVRYMQMDTAITLGSLENLLTREYYDCYPEVETELKIEIETPSPRFWVYLTLDNQYTIFMDYVFVCNTCPDNTTFHVYRKNVFADSNSCFVSGDGFFRTDINTMDYLTLGNLKE